MKYQLNVLSIIVLSMIILSKIAILGKYLIENMKLRYDLVWYALKDTAFQIPFDNRGKRWKQDEF